MRALIFTTLILSVLAFNSCNNKDEAEEIEKEEEIEGEDCMISRYLPYFPSLVAHYYTLYLSFQDTLGNDLLNFQDIGWNVWLPDRSPEENNAAIAKNRDLYTLEVIFPKIYMDPVRTYNENATTEPWRYELCIQEYENDFYTTLWFCPSHSNICYNNKKLPPADKIIYQLRFPVLFGDDKVHDIVTWWKEPEGQVNYLSKYLLCYRIELDGKEITVYSFPTTLPYSEATIVLGR